MQWQGILILAGFLGITHLILAILATSEIRNDSLFSLLSKFKWLLFVWCVPVFGVLAYHRMSGLGWLSGKVSHDNPSGGGFSAYNDSDTYDGN